MSYEYSILQPNNFEAIKTNPKVWLEQKNMGLLVVIPDDKLHNLNVQAHNALEQSVLAFANDVLDEASRLEAVTNPASGEPQIVSSYIEDSVMLIRKGYRKPRKSFRSKLVQVVSPIAWGITGLIFDFEAITSNPLIFLAFMCFFVIALVTTFMIAVNE